MVHQLQGLPGKAATRPAGTRASSAPAAEDIVQAYEVGVVLAPPEGAAASAEG